MRLLLTRFVQRTPKPLRSIDKPDGLAGLPEVDFERVSAANILFFVADVMDECTRLGKLCMVENPRNSLFWFASPWIECRSAPLLFFQDHQACAYGAAWPKRTRLCANFCAVRTIDHVCAGDHVHERWGVVRQGAKRVFATSLEAHYPKKLCDAMTHAFFLRAFSMQQTAKAVASHQTPSLRLPPLIPAFKSKLAVLFMNDAVIWPLPAPDLQSAKTLREFPAGDEGVELGNMMQQIQNELKLCLIMFTLRKAYCKGPW